MGGGGQYGALGEGTRPDGRVEQGAPEHLVAGHDMVDAGAHLLDAVMPMAISLASRGRRRRVVSRRGR
jgi:hypothetical protein